MNGTPATYFFLTIQNDRIVVVYNGTHGGEITKVIASEQAFADFIRSKAAEAGVAVDELRIACSSTLHFPEEFTDNEATRALAALLS